jgi:Family of unknown function (DUF5681)
MTGDKKNGANDVGYCKPPQNSRFKPGESGNPRGRPRGCLNLETVLQRALDEKVVINENGRCKVMTKLEAAVMQLVNKAAAGDGKAMHYLCQLVVSAEGPVAVEPTAQCSETDQKVMANILRRFEKSLRRENNEAEPE